MTLELAFDIDGIWIPKKVHAESVENYRANIGFRAKKILIRYIIQMSLKYAC